MSARLALGAVAGLVLAGTWVGSIGRRAGSRNSGVVVTVRTTAVGEFLPIPLADPDVLALYLEATLAPEHPLRDLWEDRTVGLLHVRVLPIPSLGDRWFPCMEDLRAMRKAYPSLRKKAARVGQVKFAESHLRRRGIGTQLYETALQAFAPGTFVLGPDTCGYGSTTPDAERRWTDLKRRWVSSGDLVLNRRLPDPTRPA